MPPSRRVSRPLSRRPLDTLPFFESTPEEQSPAIAGPEPDQRRLVHVLVQFLMRLATARPLLIVVEDLRWSDDASLDVLLALARRVAGHPIALLLSYRSDEVGPSLRHLLALLDRERLASEMTLSRLAPAEVDAMLRAIFDQPQPIRPDFLHAIYDLTDGNPFFIEEVIRSLIAAGGIFQAGGRWERRALAQLEIPRSVQDAVLRRSAQLSPAASKALRLAAVAGRRFDFEVLRALTGDDEARLLDAVHELVAAQLVTEESADRFAFRHALTRQAVYAAMLARERRLLHRAVAEVMERLYAAVPDIALADLSYHFAVAEAWPQALAYGERAGARALALYAPRAAVEHFTRAGGRRAPGDHPVAAALSGARAGAGAGRGLRRRAGGSPGGAGAGPTGRGSPRRVAGAARSGRPVGRLRLCPRRRLLRAGAGAGARARRPARACREPGATRQLAPQHRAPG
jgi:predicted ATPase